MKKVLLLCIVIFVCATTKLKSSEIVNTRSFQFTYIVKIEPTGGKKLELWIPVPKSNEVQIISNLKFNSLCL